MAPDNVNAYRHQVRCEWTAGRPFAIVDSVDGNRSGHKRESMHENSAYIIGLTAAFLVIGCCSNKDSGAAESSENTSATALITAQTIAAPTPLPATAAAAVKPTEESCTLATPLKPGIPGSPGHPIPSKINPNGNSELANLMRSMLSDLRQIRQVVINGQSPTIPDNHKRIRCSWHTEPKERNARYDAMAVTYLNAVDRFNKRRGEPKALFDTVVRGGCVGCHENTCQGPLAVIEPLLIESPSP